jgi:hypothetical protein
MKFFELGVDRFALSLVEGVAFASLLVALLFLESEIQ